MLRYGGAGWRPKPCELQIQSVPRGEDGEPAGVGTVLASASLDLSHYCAAHAVRAQEVVLQMQ